MNPPRDARNLLLISIDCLRSDALGAISSNNRPSLTPHLDQLCQRAACFPLTITAAPFTTPSHASILTGAWPAQHGVRTLVGTTLRRDVPTLAERLADWQSVAIPGVFILNRASGVLRGFEHVAEVVDGPWDPYGGHVRPARDVARLFLEWQQYQRDPARPWLALLHFFDAHARTANADRTHYEQGLRLIDTFVGRVLAEVDASRTVICVFGDHGEGLGDGEFGHGRTLCEAAIRVPMIVAGEAPAGIDRSLRRTIDLAPTVLGMLGHQWNPELPGADLFVDTGRRIGVTELCPLVRESGAAPPEQTSPLAIAAHDGEFKLVRDGKGVETTLAVSSNNINERSIARDQVPAARYAALVAALDRAGATATGPAAQIDDPRVIERLTSLGYLE